jgi:pyruvate,orthophosphate dikinase
VILVRPEFETSDVGALAAAAGVLTRAGARTSHAAVLARHLGKVCLVGCTDLVVDPATLGCRIGSVPLREGDEITLDGENGLVYAGRVPTALERPDRDLALVAKWRGSVPAAKPSTEIRHDAGDGP